MQAIVVQQQQANMNNNVKGMDAELYRAAKSGSFKEMSGIRTWKEQETPVKNNVLHIHLGKPVLKWPRDHKIRIGCVEFIERVVEDEDGYRLLWKENRNGDTPLHLAARFGHKYAVQVFLERAKTAVNQDAQEVASLLKLTNKKKDTALHEAARAGHALVVKLLVEAGPNCPYEPNDKGETPLYLAAERGYTPSVLTILQTCSASVLVAFYSKGPCGRTPLHAAVQWGEPEMVEMMLKKGKWLMRIQNDEGLTPFHCAAAEIYKVELLKMLVRSDEEEESPAVYIQDNMGRTPLHIAVLRKNWQAIRMLMASYPDCIEMVDNKGQHVLHYAAKWSCLRVMNQLLRAEDEDLGRFINDQDVDGNTPLHLLAASIPHTPDLHHCFDSLPLLINNYPSLDVKAFNQHNLTVGDILLSFDTLLRQERMLTTHTFPRGRRMNNYENDVDIEKETTADVTGEWNVASIKEAAQCRLVVATLIATVSFTAGFTVPGGLDQNPGTNMGMAVFKNNNYFKIFLVSDAIAFLSSTIAIIFYFVLVSTNSRWFIRDLSIWALGLNTVSLGAMMIAFLAGVSAVSSISLGLLLAISTIFVLYYCSLVARTLRSATYFFIHDYIRNRRVLQ